MKYIVIDLEMNPILKAYKEQYQLCRNEVIQIGAIVMDECYQEIGSFKTFVKPKFNSAVERRIEKLTGITTNMLQYAPDFEDALEMFFKWCDRISDEIQICEWSNNDYEQLIKEIELKEYILTNHEEKILSDWCDFQKEYEEMLGVERKLSLQNAMMYAGAEFKGNQHDALCDARNTGSLIKIVRTPELCHMALENVIDALRPKPLNNLLGNIFDFNQIVISA